MVGQPQYAIKPLEADSAELATYERLLPGCQKASSHTLPVEILRSREGAVLLMPMLEGLSTPPVRWNIDFVVDVFTQILEVRAGVSDSQFSDIVVHRRLNICTV